MFYKKLDKRMIGSYQWMSLACTDYKIIAKIITERIKPVMKQIIGTEQQGFIQGGDITGNLILVKKIIEYCKGEDIEAYMIMMDFKKASDRIDRKTMEETLRAMNFSKKIIDLVLILYAGSEAIIVTNDKKR